MIDYFKDALDLVKRVRTRRRIALALHCIGLTVTFAATARVIETSAPWWLLTVAFWLVAGWAVTTFQTLIRLDQARADVAKLEDMTRAADSLLDTLRAVGMPEEMLRRFTSAAPTDTTYDDDTDTPEPAPATTPAPVEPEPKS